MQFPLLFSITVFVAHWEKCISTLLRAVQPDAIRDFGDFQEEHYPQTLTSKGLSSRAEGDGGVRKGLGTV